MPQGHAKNFLGSFWRLENVDCIRAPPRCHRGVQEIFRTSLWRRGGARTQSTCSSLQNEPKKFFARPCGIEVAPGRNQHAQASTTSPRNFSHAPVASRWRPEAISMPKSPQRFQEIFRTPLWHRGGARTQSTCPSLQNEPKHAPVASRWSLEGINLATISRSLFGICSTCSCCFD